MAEWISVYDRLPSMREVVVATDGGNTWDVGQYRGSYMDRGPDRWVWHNHTKRVVHWWMPKKDALPKPGVAPEQERLGVPRAEWKPHEDDWYGDYWECTNCHDEFSIIEGDMYYNYCPNCGADMRGGRE